MRSEELAPLRIGTARSGPEASSAKDPPDRARSDPDAELAELALDPHAPPPRVLPPKTDDEIGHLWKDHDLDCGVYPIVGVPAIHPTTRRSNRHTRANSTSETSLVGGRWYEHAGPGDDQWFVCPSGIMPGARLLVVDLDNTLIDRNAGFERWAKVFLGDIGHGTEADLAWLRTVDDDGMASRESFFGAVRSRYNLRESTAALVARYQADFPGFIPPPSDHTFRVLHQARKAGWAICIVTNGSRKMQERKITAPLAAVVDGWVISETLGVRKPDPAILVAAAKYVERALTPDAWLIGDRPEVDIWCAVQARIGSAWVTRGYRWHDRLAYRPTIRSASVAAAVERILALG